MEHVTVFKEQGTYAGWPANYGIWSWGDEIVVGFTLGYLSDEGGRAFHPRDKTRLFRPMQARSTDGGRTWNTVPMPCRVPGNMGLSSDEHVNDELKVAPHLDGPEGPTVPSEPIDFSHPDFALMCARSSLHADAQSFFYVSYDRCRSWDGPYQLPMFDQKGIAARTDFIPLGDHHGLFLLTSTKSNGREGRVFAAETTDGGQTFQFLSWVGEEPEGFAIMPASLRLPDGRILTSIRCTDGDTHWIDLYESGDNGRSWTFVTTPVPLTGRGGNAPTLTRLEDGRLIIVYGFRDEPFGIRAVMSEDDGRTWSEPRILRDDAGNHDLGYPRTTLLSDDRLVSVYYYNDDPDAERYIGATLWRW